MGNNKKSLAAAAELRRRAEEHVKLRGPGVQQPQPADDPRRLLHELQVHAVEVEMQNIELREARTDLEELNHTLEVRIVEAVEALRQKDQMLILHDRFAVMGEMINNIAHQWRQPLNTLGLVVQQVPLLYGSDEFNLEFLKKNAAQSMELIQSMSHTINDFMNFFKSDKEVVVFSINEVITRTLSLVKKSFEDQSVGIVFHPDGDPIANGFPNEYSQVLLNILMNARDALIGNDVDDALILIHSFARGNTSVVTIIDNGGGVPNEIIDRLFDPYFTTKGPDKGTGIGLFMSKAIIEKNMGGKLTVCNVGRGAEFRIEI
jgi:C4-dicarboxylate-specific signal transduction histidine kinase